MDNVVKLLFNDGEKLIEAISVSSVFDGGQFWFTEELTFPNDKGGEVDEEPYWTKTEINRLNLKWTDGKFFPNVEELDFDQEIN
ncbi:MAG: hypothetical protein HRT57_01130 [Crocinitomicaceae bacterium]|nr:hypothetical protein [Crocinitomicaceae bacterium]